MKLSNKVNEMGLSPIRKFNPIAKEAEAKGKKIYHLNIGQPDVETPEVFMDAIKAFKKKVIAYEESGGNNDLQESVSAYYKTYGMNYDKKDIIVTNGGSEAIIMSLLSILNNGDEVLIPEPFYTNYNTFTKIANGKVVPITTKAEDGYRYADRELIESKITPNTRAIVCINPGNPTGAVLTMDDIKLIGDIAKKHDLWIIADEVYREFVYDGRKPTSFGMVPEIADRVIIVDSVSKRFSACGARIGFVISKNADFMQAIMKIAQGRLCVSTVDQVGAAELFKLPQSYYEKVKAEYCARRDVVYEEMSKIPGVVCKKPGGAFYLSAKIPVDSVEDFLMFMLTEFDVDGETAMFAPEEGFYATPGLGKDELRIAYVLKKEDMKRGAELLRLGIEAYNAKK